MTRITFGRRAQKTLRGMSEAQFHQAGVAFEQFIADRRRPGLNFEKLRGRDDLYSIRVTNGDRAILRRVVDAGGEGELFEVLLIGPHDIYKAIGRL